MRADLRVDFDILIIGMGVSGSLLSYNLAKNGFKVGCVEKGDEEDVRTIWTNEVPVEVFDSPLLLGVEIQEVFTPEITAVIRQSGETTFYIDTRNYVKSVDMRQFVRNVRNKARSIGVKLWYNTILKEIKKEGDGLLVKLQSRDGLVNLKSSYVIDSSGIDSSLRVNFFKNEISEADYILAYRHKYRVSSERIKRFWGNHRLAYGAALLRLSENGGFNTTAFYPDIKNESVDILLGGNDKDLKRRMREILKREFGIREKSISGGGGVIPIRRPFINLYKNRVFRIGDSASMTYPMCASGVATIISASTFLIEALKSENPSLYQKRFNLMIANKYALMTFFRRIIEEADREEAMLLFDMVINPLSMKYTLGNKFILRPEVILMAMKRSLGIFKKCSFVKKLGLYLLAGGLDSVLYSLSTAFDESEQLSIIESRMIKLFAR